MGGGDGDDESRGGRWWKRLIESNRIEGGVCASLRERACTCVFVWKEREARRAFEDPRRAWCAAGLTVGDCSSLGLS
jgi:hypothetical protein